MAGRDLGTYDSTPFRIPDEGLIRANDVSPKGPPSQNGGTGTMGSGNMNCLMPLLMLLMGQGGQGGGSGGPGGGNLMSILGPLLGLGGGFSSSAPGTMMPSSGPTAQPGMSALSQFLQGIPLSPGGISAGSYGPFTTPGGGFGGMMS